MLGVILTLKPPFYSVKINFDDMEIAFKSVKLNIILIFKKVERKWSVVLVKPHVIIFADLVGGFVHTCSCPSVVMITH